MEAQILNLIDESASDIKYVTSTFPDGDLHIELSEGLNRKCDIVKVRCRITNPTELYQVLLVCDILNRHSVAFDLEIAYLMSMRMDRIMSFERPFNLSVVAKAISVYKPHTIKLFTPHAYNNCQRVFERESVYIEPHFYNLTSLQVPDDIKLIIFPDKSAYDYMHMLVFTDTNHRGSTLRYCKKHRDIDTGKIHIDSIPSIDGYKKVCIFDDLVDGGGTVCAVIDKIKEENPEVEIHVAATHWVNSLGIETILHKGAFIYCTDSYKDWKSVYHSDKLIQTKIF